MPTPAKKPKKAKKKFKVLSPDGNLIQYNRPFYRGKDVAERALRRWMKQYKEQGYYSTADRDRIPLNELESCCQIIPIPAKRKKMKKRGKQFPNGIKDWIETHHEVVRFITEHDTGETIAEIGTILHQVITEQGRGGPYVLGEELTDEFELMNKGRVWDGEYFDELHLFLQERLLSTKLHSGKTP